MKFAIQKNAHWGIFTPRPLSPLHPRVHTYRTFLEEHGFTVTIINEYGQGNKWLRRLNWLTFGLIDIMAVRRSLSRLREFDVIFIHDLFLLPLSKYAKKLNKPVLYDIVDHNIHLRTYYLKRRSRIFSFFNPALLWYFKTIEKHYITNYCDHTFVNSLTLRRYIQKNVTLLYYCSPLENCVQKNNPALPKALLFVGAYTVQKGAHEMILLSRELTLPLYIFGPITDSTVQAAVAKHPLAVYLPKISVGELGSKIQELLQKHFLLGASIIFPVNYSYATQEANKDIDYLALGIPIIGNDRQPTREKIEAGAGLYYDDPVLKEKLNDRKLLEQMSVTGKAIYNEKYSHSHFSSVFEKALHHIFDF